MKKVLKKYQWGLTPMVSFFAGVEHEPEACYDEGDAQELTHVKGHALLKIHLDLLAELNEKAECEDGGYAESKVKSGAYLVFVLAVDKHDDSKDYQVGNSLVKLCRMACKILAVLDKDETPVGAGGLAHDLGVHEVAQTDAGGGERGGHADHIYALQDLDLVLAAVKPHSYYDADGTAVAGKSAVTNKLYASLRHETYGQEHLDEMLAAGKIIFGFVKDAVTQASAYEYAQEAVEEQRLICLFLDTAVLIEFLDNKVCGHQTYYPHEGVVSDRES